MGTMLNINPDRERSVGSVGAEDEPTTSILLIGFYGRANFGDDLMCSSLANFLSQNRNYSISVVSGHSNSEHLDIGRGSFVARDARAILAALSDTDILCQGGGTIFHDSYFGIYRFRYWINLIQWAILFWIARLRGARVVMVGAGVGPLRHIVSRCIARVAFAACFESLGDSRVSRSRIVASSAGDTPAASRR